MAASKRNSGRRKAAPGPINTTSRHGVKNALNSAICSATMIEHPIYSESSTFPTSRKSSLRNSSSKTSSPIKRVGFESQTEPRTGLPTPPEFIRRTPSTIRKTIVRGPVRTSPKKTSPKQVSPRTAAARKARAEAYQKYIASLGGLYNEEPSPSGSKRPSTRFVGPGKRLGNDKKSSQATEQSSPHPKIVDPGTQYGRTLGSVQKKRQRAKQRQEHLEQPTNTSKPKTATFIVNPRGSATRVHVEKVSEWLQGPTAPRMSPGEGEDAIEIPTKVLLEHMHDIKHHLRPLSLEELHVQFYLLQKMLRQFCKRFFADVWDERRVEDFADGFADLKHQQPAFFRMLSYIADGSGFRDGWQDFLSSEHSRPHVVYGVLGEWLKYNVFGHSCFGLSPEEDEQMTAIDIQYIKYDGFVRTKERAKLLKGILADKPKWEFDADMSVAVDVLVDELMVVLEPILPTCKKALGEMKTKLTLLVDIAANLHLCIRLTGVDGTILRFHSASKNDQFAFTARQNCVNKSLVEATHEEMIAARNVENRALDRPTEKDPRRSDKLKIKMPLFPLVLAVVPYGPTLKDFAVEQAHYEAVLKSPDLPHNKDKGPMYVDDIPAEIVRAACFEELPDSVRKDSGYRSHRGEKPKKAFGSYVRQYILNEADVYCEWDFPDTELGPGHALTLGQAVGAAYRTKYPHAQTKLVIARATVGLVATALVGGAAYAIATHTPLGRAAVNAVKGLNLPSRISVGDVKGAVASAMEKAKSKGKAFRALGKVNKDCLRAGLRLAQPRVRQLANKASVAVSSFAYGVPGLTSPAAELTEGKISKAANLREAATGILKDAVMPEDTIEPTTTGSLLSNLLPKISVGFHETPVKVGIEIPKILDPTSRVSKTTKAVQASETAKTAAKRLMEYGARMFGDARGLVNRG